jgi:hypothetical protein
MSVSKLSKVLQSEILDKLLAKIDADISKVAETLPGKRFGGTFIKIQVTSTNVTRLLTDPNQTGIFGKSGLAELASGFNNIASGLASAGPRVISTKDGTISKQPGYKALKDYLKNNIKNSPDQVEALQNIVKDLASQANKVLSDPNLYNDFLTYVNNTQKYTVENLNSDTFAILKTEHSTINKLFSEYLSLKTSNQVLVDFINANTDAGHLLGIFNQKLFRAFGATVDDNNYSFGELSVDIAKNLEINSDADRESIKKLNETFSAAFNLLEDIDLLSSSLKTRPDIFVKLSKEVYIDPNNPKSAAEIQIAWENSKVGQLLSTAGNKLEKLIAAARSASYYTPAGSTSQLRKPDSLVELENIFKDIGNLAKISKEMASSLAAAEDKLLQEYAKKITQRADKFGDILLNAEGSDSIPTAIGKTLANIMGGKSIPKASLSEVSKSSKSTNKKVSKTSTNIKKIQQTKPKSTTITAKKLVNRNNIVKKSVSNLTSLQRLLDAQLVQQVKQNMGTGNRRDILNLRTGRFAESVKVERLSESREGMITAFYSYMRNPYATFSAGGRQESPKTRDPKLLISKSIREVAAQLVTNRLRSVNV